MALHRVIFLFQSWPHTDILHWYLLWCLLLLLGSIMVAVCTNSWGSIIWFCTTATIWSIPMACIYISWCWFMAHTRVHVVAGSQCFDFRCLMLLKLLLPQPFNQYPGVYNLGTQQSHVIPVPFLHGREEYLFPGLIPPSDTVNY